MPIRRLCLCDRITLGIQDLVDHVGDETSQDRILHGTDRLVVALDEHDARADRHVAALFDELLSTCRTEALEVVVYRLNHPVVPHVDVLVARRCPLVLATPVGVSAVYRRHRIKLLDELLGDQVQLGRCSSHADHVQLTFYSVGCFF